MSDNPILDQLHHLVTTNNDVKAALKTAAKNVRNSEVETLFTAYADQHARFAAELETAISRVGETVPSAASVRGVIQRGWMDLTAALTEHSAGSMLSACEDVELSAESKYLDALDIVRTGQAHTLLEKHLEQIRGFRTRVARLLREVKDGVDFQDNE